MQSQTQEQLSIEEQAVLLRIARQAIQAAVTGQHPLALDLKELPPRLREPGATFVTLTRAGALRGCIGALEAYLPLAEDVRQHAIAAALEDYRFPPVQEAELASLTIEISRLTPPRPLDYSGPAELLDSLRPGVDGLILVNSFQRATFLPQVWEKLPDKVTFLEHLCQKMGAPPDLWRRKQLQAFTYQVEEFHEGG